MKKLKTTIAGVATAVVAVSHALIELYNGGSPDWATVVASVTTALGLLFARDSR